MVGLAMAGLWIVMEYRMKKINMKTGQTEGLNQFT
jgi:hypothetical protein